MGAHWPSTTWMSVRQSPAAPTLTMTSKAFSILGSSTCSTLRLSAGMLASYLCSLAACISRSPSRLRGGFLSLRHAVPGRQEPPAEARVPLDAHPHRLGETEMLDDRLLGHPSAVRVHDEGGGCRDVQPQLRPALEILPE